MDATEVQTIFRQRLGLRIGDQTAEYVLRRLREGAASALPPGAIPVMGNDARTGVPVRRFVDVSEPAPLAPRSGA